MSWEFSSLRHSRIFWTIFPGGWVVKNLPANSGVAGDAGLIPGSGRYPGGGNGDSLQYSCLDNPMDRRALWAQRVFEWYSDGFVTVKEPLKENIFET